MLVQPCVFVHLRHLGFGHFAGEDAAHALAARMHVQHDLGRAFAVHAEERLQHDDHEIHRREIVVEQHDMIAVPADPAAHVQQDLWQECQDRAELVSHRLGRGRGVGR